MVNQGRYHSRHGQFAPMTVTLPIRWGGRAPRTKGRISGTVWVLRFAVGDRFRPESGSITCHVSENWPTERCCSSGSTCERRDAISGFKWPPIRSLPGVVRLSRDRVPDRSNSSRPSTEGDRTCLFVPSGGSRSASHSLPITDPHRGDPIVYTLGYAAVSEFGGSRIAETRYGCNI